MKIIILLTFILVFKSFSSFGNPNGKGVVCKCIKCDLNSIFFGTYLIEEKPTEIGFLFKDNVVNIFIIGKKNDEIYYDEFEKNKKFRFRVTNEKIIWDYYKYRTFTLNRKDLKLYNEFKTKDKYRLNTRICSVHSYQNFHNKMSSIVNKYQNLLNEKLKDNKI